MNTSKLKIFFNSKFNIGFIISCLFVFSYLLFSATYSSLVCDELTTFFRFIQPRAFIGTYSDANNHLLNTFLAHISHTLFGFSSFSIRLFSLLSVFIYFFYTYRFSKEIENRLQRVLFVFVMLFSLNFLQFFALSRGYGFSFAFLLAALYHFNTFIKNTSSFDVKNLGYFSLFISLCLFANLATLLTSLTINFFLLVYCFLKKNLFIQLRLKAKIIFFIITISYTSVLLLMIYYSFLLKENGALYYGNLQSFWYNIVVTQLHLLIEAKSTFIQIILAIYLLVIVIIAVLSQKKIKFKDYFKFNIFFIVLTFNLIGIELLALLFKVNYPSDRVAIHLYLLLILALFFIEIKDNILLKNSKLVLVFLLTLVPIHNILTVNYKNNTVWPLDYFPKSYYNKIIDGQNDFKFYPTVSGDTFRGLSYVKHVYENNGKGNLPIIWEENDINLLDSENHPGKYSDFIIAKHENVKSIAHLYQKVDSNNINKICLWERVNKATFTELENNIFDSPQQTSNEFFDCGEITIDSLNNKYFLVDVEFDIDAVELPFNGSLILNVHDETTDERLLYDNYEIRHLKSFKTSNKFKQRIILKKIHPNHKIRISSYIWNIEKESVAIKNGKITFYKFTHR